MLSLAEIDPPDFLLGRSSMHPAHHLLLQDTSQPLRGKKLLLPPSHETMKVYSLVPTGINPLPRALLELLSNKE